VIGLVGATGFTGRLCAAELARRGVPHRLVARDPVRLARVAEAHGAVAATAVASADDPASLARALDGCDVVLATVGPFAIHGEATLAAAADVGAHYLDITGERDGWHDRFAAGGLTAIPAMAFEYALGECAARLALDGLEAAAVDVLYVARGGGVSHGTARSALGVVAAEGIARDRGVPVPWRLGHTTQFEAAALDRPRHAVEVPGAEALWLPASATSVHTWVAFPSRVARLVRTFGRAAQVLGRGPIAAIAAALVDRRVVPPDDAARAAGTFAVTARARSGGAERWCVLRGGDPYGITAVIAADGAIRLASGTERASGVVSPATAFPVDELLASWPVDRIPPRSAGIDDPM
jgi:short subunit dehydrogenase-like uncharacterized protein